LKIEGSVSVSQKIVLKTPQCTQNMQRNCKKFALAEKKSKKQIIKTW